MTLARPSGLIDKRPIHTNLNWEEKKSDWDKCKQQPEEDRPGDSLAGTHRTSLRKAGRRRGARQKGPNWNMRLTTLFVLRSSAGLVLITVDTDKPERRLPWSKQRTHAHASGYRK